MSEFKSKNLILFTGAGFTKNFGGFLADEMWAHIYNHPLIQSTPQLKKVLNEDFDFESAYSSVMEDVSITPEDKERMSSAVLEAYRRLDFAIKDWNFNTGSPHPVNWYGLNNLIQLFVGRGQETGLFFTLNQDLFMERRSGFSPPGVPRFKDDFYHHHSLELKPEEFITLPSTDAVARFEKGIEGQSGLVYIKLHGSYGWKSSSGSSQLVIGKNKTTAIADEPLLKRYFELFESVIREGNKKMLILGYGFHDKHINQILLEGVQNHGLKIFIMSTRSPRDFKENLRNGHYYAMPIWDGLSGYFPQPLKEIFPGNQQQTVHFDVIRKALESS